jgi:hypothetical protein
VSSVSSGRSHLHARARSGRLSGLMAERSGI